MNDNKSPTSSNSNLICDPVLCGLRHESTDKNSTSHVNSSNASYRQAPSAPLSRRPSSWQRLPQILPCRLRAASISSSWLRFRPRLRTDQQTVTARNILAWTEKTVMLTNTEQLLCPGHPRRRLDDPAVSRWLSRWCRHHRSSLTRCRSHWVECSKRRTAVVRRQPLQQACRPPVISRSAGTNSYIWDVTTWALTCGNARE